MPSNPVTLKVNIGEAVVTAIRDEIDRRLNEGPICPFCHTKLVRIHIELEDKSGWLHGWTCNCAQNEAQAA